MTVIHVNALQLPAVLEAHAKKLPQAFQVACVLAAERGRSYLVRQSPVDLGQFKNSWKVKHGSNGPVIVNDAPHAGIIENGARPHPVSREGIEALTQWAKRKLLMGARMSRKKYLASGRKLSKAALSTTGKKGQHWADVEARNIAFAIAGKLKKEGQKGLFITQKSIPQLAKFLAIELAKQINKALASKGF